MKGFRWWFWIYSLSSERTTSNQAKDEFLFLFKTTIRGEISCLVLKKNDLQITPQWGWEERWSDGHFSAYFRKVWLIAGFYGSSDPRPLQHVSSRGRFARHHGALRLRRLASRFLYWAELKMLAADARAKAAKRGSMIFFWHLWWWRQLLEE